MPHEKPRREKRDETRELEKRERATKRANWMQSGFVPGKARTRDEKRERATNARRTARRRRGPANWRALLIPPQRDYVLVKRENAMASKIEPA